MSDKRQRFDKPGIECPGCGEFFLMKESEGESLSMLKRRVMNHVRRKSDSDHGKKGSIPKGFGLEINMDIEKLEEETKDSAPLTRSQFVNMSPNQRRTVMLEHLKDGDSYTLNGLSRKITGKGAPSNSKIYRTISNDFRYLKGKGHVVTGKSKKGTTTYQIPLEERDSDGGDEADESRTIKGRTHEEKVEFIKEYFREQDSGTVRDILAWIKDTDPEELNRYGEHKSSLNLVGRTLRNSDEFSRVDKVPAGENEKSRASVWSMGEGSQEYETGEKWEILGTTRRDKVELVKSYFEEHDEGTAKEVTAWIEGIDEESIDTNNGASHYISVINTLNESDLFEKMDPYGAPPFLWILSGEELEAKEETDSIIVESYPHIGSLIESYFEEHDEGTAKEVTAWIEGKDENEVSTNPSDPEYNRVLNYLNEHERFDYVGRGDYGAKIWRHTEEDSEEDEEEPEGYTSRFLKELMEEYSQEEPSEDGESEETPDPSEEDVVETTELKIEKSESGDPYEIDIQIQGRVGEEVAEILKGIVG